MRSMIDIGWLAGIVEGEGCLSNGANSVTININMTDKDVMERVASLMGGKLFGPMARPAPRKPMYQVRINGKKVASWMMTLYPLLHSRRQAKARELLLRWKSQVMHNGDKESCLNGHSLAAGPDVYMADGKYRRCRPCQAKRQREFKARRKMISASPRNTHVVASSQHGWDG